MYCLVVKHLTDDYKNLTRILHFRYNMDSIEDHNKISQKGKDSVEDNSYIYITKSKSIIFIYRDIFLFVRQKIFENYTS